MGTHVQYGRWSTDLVCGVGGNTIWTVAQCLVCKVGGKCIGRRQTTWALIDLMERDRSDWPFVPLKVCFEQDDNDIDVEAHYYPRKRFLAMAYIGVIYPIGTPSKQYDPCTDIGWRCVFLRCLWTRVKEYFTNNMQYSNKAKQSIVKTFVHSRAYYLLFALKILFNAVVTNFVLFFKLRQTFLHFRNFQETQLNLPTLLDLSQMTKEGMYLEMRKDKILFLPSSSKISGHTQWCNSTCTSRIHLVTAGATCNLHLLLYFLPHKWYWDEERFIAKAHKHEKRWKFLIISIYTALFFSWHLDSGLVLFNNNSQKPLW